MSLFRFLWLKRLVRRHTSPIPENRAILWKKRISLVYMLITWNAFGFVCYMIYTGRSDWAKYYGFKSDDDSNISPGKQWAKILGVKNGTLYRVSGFNISSEEITDTTDEKKQTDIDTKK